MEISRASTQRKPLTPKKHPKSRSGCQRCKQRHIKCDEKLPSCGPCSKKGFHCPGYQQPIQWRYLNSTGHSPQNTGAQSGGHIRPRDRFLNTPPRITSADESDVPSGPDTSRGPSLSSIPSTVAPGCEKENEDEASSRAFPEALELEPTAEQATLDFSEFLMDYTNDLDFGQLWDVDQSLQDHLPGDDEFYSIFQSPISPSLDDKTMLLSNHYFSTVCCINSCFDSHHNPFRSLVGDLMASSPFIHHVVMMVSASHICHLQSDMLPVALKKRKEAIALLKETKQSVNKKFEVVLGSVLLGMTSAWQDPSLLGLSHLRNSRVLFKEWYSDSCTTTSAPSRSFIVGIMTYWEAMASFLTTEGPVSLTYLTPFEKQEHLDDIVYPNPWTGSSTTLFIYAGGVGALCRQNRAMHALSASTTSSVIRDETYAQQFNEAIELERKTLQYSPPHLDRIADSSDTLTATCHFEYLAKIYRLAILIQLYITFPGLLETSSKGESSCAEPALQQSHQRTAAQEIVALAISLLNIVASIPKSSGINVLLTIPLIIAGSALQNVQQAAEGASGIGHSKVMHEILSINCSHHILSHWRAFVQQRLQFLHEQIALGPILRGMQILDGVWLRADMSPSTNRGTSKASLIHWLDVMTEERLESIFG